MYSGLDRMVAKILQEISHVYVLPYIIPARIAFDICICDTLGNVCRGGWCP